MQSANLTFIELFLQLVPGVMFTVIVTITCCITAFFIGVFVTALRGFSITIIDIFFDIFSYIFRSLPILVLIFLVFFGLPKLGIYLTPLLAMNLSLGVIAGANVSEVFRGSMLSVNSDEILAAKSMGMNKIQIFTYIKMPQILRFSFPGLVNEFTSVLKYSPFSYTVGISEITKQAMTLTATTAQGVEIYLIVGLLYFAIYRIFLTMLKTIEKKFHVAGIDSFGIK